jgi:23S rRNA pseudouridine1911/1915/1917 synthase
VYGEERWRTVRDPARREALRAFPRPALHAWRLELPHPGGEGRLRLAAPIPEDLRRLWSAATGAEWPGSIDS